MRVESQVYVFNASIGSVVDEQERQTSRLVWWMVKSSPVFCSLASWSNLHELMIMTPSTAFENSPFFQIWKASHQEMGLSRYVDKEALEALYCNVF